MSSRTRLAIVGCGGVSRIHFEGYLSQAERLEIVAAVDPSPERRDHVKTKYDIGNVYESVEQALVECDFDVAVVCTPSPVRLEVIDQLAQAGKGLHVEKPLAATHADASQIVNLANAHEVELTVGQNYREYYPFAMARQLIQAGAIGSVLSVEHRDLVYRNVTGWRAHSERHALSVMGIHWLDGFRHLLHRDADRVTAVTKRAPHMEVAGETDAVVQLEFGDIPVNYIQSFSSWSPQTMTTVIGDKGALELDYQEVRIRTQEGSRTIVNPLAHSIATSVYRCLLQLVEAMRTGEEADISGRDNLKTLSLLEAVYKSHSTKGPVHLSEGELK